MTEGKHSVLLEELKGFSPPLGIFALSLAIGNDDLSLPKGSNTATIPTTVAQILAEPYLYQGPRSEASLLQTTRVQSLAQPYTQLQQIAFSHSKYIAQPIPFALSNPPVPFGPFLQINTLIQGLLRPVLRSVVHRHSYTRKPTSNFSYPPQQTSHPQPNPKKLGSPHLSEIKNPSSEPTFYREAKDDCGYGSNPPSRFLFILLLDPKFFDYPEFRDKFRAFGELISFRKTKAFIYVDYRELECAVAAQDALDNTRVQQQSRRSATSGGDRTEKQLAPVAPSSSSSRQPASTAQPSQAQAHLAESLGGPESYKEEHEGNILATESEPLPTSSHPIISMPPNGTVSQTRDWRSPYSNLNKTGHRKSSHTAASGESSGGSWETASRPLPTSSHHITTMPPNGTVSHTGAWMNPSPYLNMTGQQQSSHGTASGGDGRNVWAAEFRPRPTSSYSVTILPPNGTISQTTAGTSLQTNLNMTSNQQSYSATKKLPNGNSFASLDKALISHNRPRPRWVFLGSLSDGDEEFMGRNVPEFGIPLRNRQSNPPKPPQPSTHSFSHFTDEAEEGRVGPLALIAKPEHKPHCQPSDREIQKIATVQKIVTEILPPSSGLAFGKDARDLLIECCVEFITLISSEANEISEKESKKTIACEHITKALEQLGFGDYVPDIMEVANEHKEQLKGREKKANKLEQSGLSTEQLLAMQEAAFRDAAQRHG
ncbi:hypothetical protein G7Y89_g5037 [Cudoniella acicularis]|uniref:NCT transcriptional regulatory complex subunit B n=1 Tax=Cudoniella acicularis TaxID=354080 RepID=A0A8H4RRD0_9HELO|nr:hypothetical protein G7Y89_g5037 [Cudoniella acicularis]